MPYHDLLLCHAALIGGLEIGSFSFIRCSDMAFPVWIILVYGCYHIPNSIGIISYVEMVLVQDGCLSSISSITGHSGLP
jgi:hypothetical protein